MKQSACAELRRLHWDGNRWRLTGNRRQRPRRGRIHCNTAFDDRDDGAVRLLVHIKLRAHRAHPGGTDRDDKRATRVVCDVKECLTLDQFDIALLL